MNDAYGNEMVENIVNNDYGGYMVLKKIYKLFNTCVIKWSCNEYFFNVYMNCSLSSSVSSTSGSVSSSVLYLGSGKDKLLNVLT